MVKIILDENYKVPIFGFAELQGPEIIRVEAKKAKSQGSMSRIFGLYNKKYLTLDTKQLLFFYGSDEKTSFKKAKIIRLQVYIYFGTLTLKVHKQSYSRSKHAIHPNK